MSDFDPVKNGAGQFATNSASPGAKPLVEWQSETPEERAARHAECDAIIQRAASDVEELARSVLAPDATIGGKRAKRSDQ